MAAAASAGGGADATAAAAPAGRPSTDNNFSSSEALTVSLTLPGHSTMRHIDGKWVSDAPPPGEALGDELPNSARMAELLRQITGLEARLIESRDENEALKEENALHSLRNKMLVEMLAVSQLDTGRALDELKSERLRVEALKWELARISLAHSTGAITDLDADTSVPAGQEAILVPALAHMDRDAGATAPTPGGGHSAAAGPPTEIFSARPAASAAAGGDSSDGGGAAEELLEESMDA